MKSIFAAILFVQALSAVAQNVGIGTETPLQRLHVVGNAFISDKIGVGVSNPQAPIHLRNEVGNKRILLYDAFGDDHQYYGFGINPGVLRYQSDGDHVFFTGQSAVSTLEVMRLKENGNVGIGTSDPQSRFSVNGTAEVTGNTVISGNLSVGLANAAYRLDVGGSARFNGDLFLNSPNVGGTWLFISNFYGSPTGWKMVATPDGKLKYFNTNNNSALTLLQNGRVGIGTDNPAYPLDVVGAASVSGNFSIGGVLGFGHQVVTTEVIFAANGINSFNKPCPAGTKILSGGGGYPGYDPNIANDIITIYNGPDPDFPETRWRLYIWNKNNESVPIKLICICANIY